MKRPATTALLAAALQAFVAWHTLLASEESSFELVVLGIAQDGGVPHLGCDKVCCTEARKTGQDQTPACLGIHDPDSQALVLIEATPAIETQVALLQTFAGTKPRGRKPIDAVLLTHAHIGHYVGLVQLGREVAGAQEIPVHASPRMATFLETNGPWSLLVELRHIRIVPFQPKVRFEPLPGLEVEAIPVPHRDEFTDTMAFRIHGPNRTVLFVPDVDSWDKHPGLLDSLLAGVDLAYVDGTFYDGRELPDRNLAEIPHPLMTDTMTRLAKLGAERPGAVRFIHLNHTNPALRDSLIRADVQRRGFRIAEPGEKVSL